MPQWRISGTGTSWNWKQNTKGKRFWIVSKKNLELLAKCIVLFASVRYAFSGKQAIDHLKGKSHKVKKANENFHLSRKLLFTQGNYSPITNGFWWLSLANCTMTTHGIWQWQQWQLVLPLSSMKKSRKPMIEFKRLLWLHLISHLYGALKFKCRYFDSERVQIFPLNVSRLCKNQWQRVLVDTDKVNDYESFQSTLQVHLTTGPEDQQTG